MNRRGGGDIEELWYMSRGLEGDMADEDWKDDLRAIREVLNPRVETSSSYESPKATGATLFWWAGFTAACFAAAYWIEITEGGARGSALLVGRLLVAAGLIGGIGTAWTLIRLMFRF